MDFSVAKATNIPTKGRLQKLIMIFSASVRLCVKGFFVCFAAEGRHAAGRA
jgi:hypothetical protein